MLIFERGRGLDPTDLWVATRRGWNFSWSDVVPLDTINSTSYEGKPRLLSDGKSMLFSSDRGGQSDIYLARLVRKDTPVEPTKRLEGNQTPATPSDKP